MNAPTAYPLAWPDGWPRTPMHQREDGRHRFTRPKSDGYGRKAWTFAEARDGLVEELRKLGARNPVLSTNFQIASHGLPSKNRGAPDDQGVAVYFELSGKSMAMGRDAFMRAEENMRSLTLAVSALRQLERHGGGTMLERAFSGFQALPNPDRQDWRSTLGLGPDAGLTAAEAAYRTGVKQFHPDRPTGDAEQFHKINQAIEQARTELS